MPRSSITFLFLIALTFIAKGRDLVSANDHQSVVEVAKKRFNGDLTPSETRLLETVDLETEPEAINFATLKNPIGLQGKPLIRADRLNWLCREKTLTDRFASRGLYITNERITGELNLRGASVAFPISFVSCLFENDIHLEAGRFYSLSFVGCNLQDFFADAIHVTGQFDLRLSSLQSVFLRGADIGGDMDCSGTSVFAQTPSGVALNLDRATVNRSLFLRSGFVAVGLVRLVAANVARDFDASDGHFYCSTDDRFAINAERAKIGLDVEFISTSKTMETNMLGPIPPLSEGIAGRQDKYRDRFYAEGTISFVGAQIGGNFQCSGGTFLGSKTRLPDPSPIAIEAFSARIKGRVQLDSGFRALGVLNFAFTEILDSFWMQNVGVAKGYALDLSSASVETLVDATNSWPQSNALRIQGLRYNRIDGSSPRRALEPV